MWAELSVVFTQILGWIGEFVTAMTSESGSLAGLLPLFLLGIGVSLALVSSKIVRKITWGA